MWTEFQPGQIVVRRLGLIQTTLRRSRHSFTFGAPCLVRKKRLVNLRADDMPCIYLKHNRQRNNNGTYQEGHVEIRDVHMLGVDPRRGDAYMPYAHWWLRQE